MGHSKKKMYHELDHLEVRFLLGVKHVTINTFEAFLDIAKLWPFLDAFSHLYKRVCLSIRPSVRRSVGPSVRPT